MSRLFPPVAWIQHSNIYEVNVRQYSLEGSFEAFAKHLPRLKDMGVQTLWFMPITPISVEGRLGTLGSYYACSDYTAINPEFGTIDNFRELVEKAHELGLKVIIDWVANHTGKDHIWTQTNPGFYKKNAEGQFYDSNGWQDVIDLNYYDGLMRKAMIEAMQFWVEECGIDGFRCDMAHLVPLDFWKQARVHLDAIKPLFWLGETEDIHYLDVFDACYAWTWMHETEKFSKGSQTLYGLKQCLIHYQDHFPENTCRLFFTSNHDENSWNGTEYEKYGELSKVLTVLNTTWSGIPLIYSGQELPNLKRLKFFEKDLIEWNDQPALHTRYKQLSALKLSHPALNCFTAPVLIPNSAENNIFSYVRRSQGREVVTVLNFSGHTVPVQLSGSVIKGVYQNLFTGQEIAWNDSLVIELKPYESLVLHR